MLMTLEATAKAAHATVLHPANISLTGATSDNRTVLHGQLFVAIQGERVDGHTFAASAVHAGAAAVLAERDPFAGKGTAPVLLVQDSVKALGLIAHAWRTSFRGKVVGLTGTAGKTTTRELLTHILSCHGKTACTAMNLNTQVGMPVSMLATDGDEKFWVMEVGISHPNDMDELGSILEPDLALILNVGVGHTLGLGSKGTAYYKSRLLDHLKKDGIALISADYEELLREARVIRPDAIFFSTSGRTAPYQAKYLGLDRQDRGHYRLWLTGETFDVDCVLSGAYAAENIIAAAAAAHIFGVPRHEIVRGIQCAPLPYQRFNRQDMGAWTVIDDTYNANPLSSVRMIEAAHELAHGRPFLCVMGTMAELGNMAGVEHRKLGQALARSGCKAVFWTGDHAADVEKGLVKEAFTGWYTAISTPPELLRALTCWKEKTQSASGGLILFKGSRSNHMERFMKLFKEWVCHAI